MSPRPKTAERRSFPRSVLGFFTGMFTRNLSVKLAALVLAILVWFTVRQNLTSTLLKEAIVRVDLDQNLMLTAPPPTMVEVEFQGPTSQINLLKRQDAAIHLLVHRDDLNGALTARLRFSPGRGNVLHRYGSDVRIVSMNPSPIELGVAVEGEQEVELADPQVRLTLPGWTEGFLYLVTKKVTLQGPKAVLDGLKGQPLRPPPVDADEILAGRQEETFGPIELPLHLPADLRRQGVELAPGQSIRFSASFVHSGIAATLRVPFRIYYDTADSTDVVTPVENDLVHKTGEGAFDIQVTFTGTEVSLARLRSDVKEKRVRVFVLASEFQIPRGPPTKVHVQIPEELWGKVTVKPIDNRQIDLQRVPRKDK